MHYVKPGSPGKRLRRYCRHASRQGAFGDLWVVKDDVETPATAKMSIDFPTQNLTLVITDTSFQVCRRAKTQQLDWPPAGTPFGIDLARLGDAKRAPGDLFPLPVTGLAPAWTDVRVPGFFGVWVLNAMLRGGL
jgi:hypothetical protein